MTAPRPNFVVCMCDELRWCNVGCYGHPTCRTPAIDALAADGVRFDTAISNNPVCLPARSILLSGQHSRTCATLNNVDWKPGVSIADAGFPQWPTAPRNHLPDPTLPELLRGAGYRTAAIGKWHVDAWPDAVGFERFAIPAHHHANTAQWFLQETGRVYSPPGFGIDHELDLVEAWLHDRRRDGEPFFLYLNLSPPHMPLMDAPPRYLSMYRREDVAARGNVPEGYDPPRWNKLAYLWDYRGYRDRLPYCTVPEATDLVELERLYMGLTTWVDDAVARLRAALTTRGFDDNTVVAFTADHGDNLGSHGRMGKGQMTDESCRVPMCVAGAGIEPGVAEEQVASLVDLPATFLAMAGVDAPGHMHGQDLGPVLRGESPSLDRDHAFLENTHQCGVRTPTHTLWFEVDGETRELGAAPAGFHDNAADPLQLTNLIETGEQAGARDRLAGAVRAWHAATPWRATV